jgi:hypothetical protein
MANNLESNMSGTFFFLWLNDTTPDRYYWRDEAEYADRTTKAEVIVQPMLRQAA